MRKIVFLLVCSLVAASSLVGCKDKTPAEKREIERNNLREVKRKKAAEFYKQFAKDFPDDPRAADAAARAKKLEAPSN